MYTLIIADDERIECRSLEIMIEKNFPNIVLLPSVNNGISLLKTMQQEKPDIAIVDINMPGLNGLEVIEIMRMKSIETKVLIHTACCTVDVLQKAVVLGASNYLLKPLEETKLIDAVIRVIGVIEQERIREENSKLSMKTSVHARKVAEDGIIPSLILGIPNADAFLLWTGKDSRFIHRMIVGKIRHGDEDGTLLESLKKQLYDTYRKIVRCSAQIIKGILYLYIAVDMQDTRNHEDGWIEEILEKNITDMQLNHNAEICFIVSQWQDQFRNMDKACQECIYMLNRTVGNGIEVFESTSPVYRRFHHMEKASSKLTEYFNQHNWEGIGAQVRQVTEDLQKTDYTENERVVYLACMIKYCHLISEYGRTNRILWTDLFRGMKKNYHDQEKLIADLIAYCKEKNVMQQAKDAREQYIDKAIAYMEQYYKKDISLEDVAHEIGISAFYLSRLLKQKRQTGFVELLTEIRIDHAVELILEDNEMIIKDIGELVGYTSSTYFYRVFKKSTGITIGNMRTLLQ